MTPKIRTTYRALLRELPRRTLASPTPLHTRIRELYRRPLKETAAASALPLEAEQHRRLQEAEQLAQYARAQRMYTTLVERYNPGATLTEQERIRLTARRVGWDLPVEKE